MIVERWTFRLKHPGTLPDLAALLKSECEENWGEEGLPYRIYTPNYATDGTAVLELEYESLAQAEEGAAMFKRFVQLIEDFGTEVWNLG